MYNDHKNHRTDQVGFSQDITVAGLLLQSSHLTLNPCFLPTYSNLFSICN